MGSPLDLVILCLYGLVCIIILYIMFVDSTAWQLLTPMTWFAATAVGIECFIYIKNKWQSTTE